MFSLHVMTQTYRHEGPSVSLMVNPCCFTLQALLIVYLSRCQDYFSSDSSDVHVLHNVFTLFCPVSYTPTVTGCRSVTSVCKLNSHVFVETVCGSEHPAAADDCPAAVMPGQDLDADLPWPRPLRSLLAPHYTRHTWRGNEGPLSTTSQTDTNEMSSSC